MKAALIIGHAGHELRVLKFIELFKPVVCILTDGSGSSGVSRIENTFEVLEYYDCYEHFFYLTDKEMYEAILGEKAKKITAIKNIIRERIRYCDLVLGDSAEGFNPTHDLCRAIINSIAGNRANYEFDLDKKPEPLDITIKLSQEDKIKRDEHIKNYPEIQKEVDMAKEHWGEDAFDFEYLRLANTKERTGKPFYETGGGVRVNEGVYKELITEQHLKNIISHL